MLLHKPTFASLTCIFFLLSHAPLSSIAFLDIFPDIWEKSHSLPSRKQVDLGTGVLADFPIYIQTDSNPSRPYQGPRFLDPSHHEALLRSHIESYPAALSSERHSKISSSKMNMLWRISSNLTGRRW